MAASFPARFRGPARRDAAAFYLSQLSRGFLSGELTLLSGDQSTRLVTADVLVLRIDVRRMKRATELVVRARWSNPDPVEPRPPMSKPTS